MAAKPQQKINTEVVILGDGIVSLFVATKLMHQGVDVVIVNPYPDFSVGDIRPKDGLGLWNAAYRSNQPNVSLANVWDQLQDRLKEAMPISVAQAGLKKHDSWGVLSSVPVHQQISAMMEEEYFRLERKTWSQGHTKLVDSELMERNFKSKQIKLFSVASAETAIHRDYAINWDYLNIAKSLSEFVYRKQQEGKCRIFTSATIESRLGRRITLSAGGEKIALEYTKNLYILLTGELIPYITKVIKGAEENAPWLAAIRKKRREHHWAFFERRTKTEEPFWYQLGLINYFWMGNKGFASWGSRSGPDGLDLVIDEGIRLGLGNVSRVVRAFYLEWEWKIPQWKSTEYQTYWGSAFEGDLWSAMELLWNMPN